MYAREQAWRQRELSAPGYNGLALGGGAYPPLLPGSAAARQFSNASAGIGFPNR